jgi:MFS transporter, SP family, general alpha glucoside:H+ symporter
MADTWILQAGICFCCVVYTYFRLPEPRGRTFAELDVLFEKHVSARNFASTKVDVFHETVDEKIMNHYVEVNVVEGGNGQRV